MIFTHFMIPLFATLSYTWTADVNSELDLSGNWTPTLPPSPPTTYDLEIFDNLAATKSPLLDTGDTFAMYMASFNTATESYTFHISNNSILEFGLSGDLSGMGGVENDGTGSVAQNFLVDGNGTINFVGTASAQNFDGAQVIYTIGSTNTGLLNFEESSTAGFATIFAGDTAGGSIVTFSQAADAGYASLNIGSFGSTTRASLVFTDTSTAGNALINIGDSTGMTNSSGTLVFLSGSTAGNATINVSDHLGDSSVTFSSDSSTVYATAGSATINVMAASGSVKGTDGLVTFNGYATAGQATITIGDTASNGAITFNQFSSGANATIILGNKEKNFKAIGTFNNSSTADHAQIFVNNASTLNFNAGTTAAFSKISVNDASALNFATGSLGDSCAIYLMNEGSLFFASPDSYTAKIVSSDSTSPINIEGAGFTLNYDEKTPIAIDGPINGGNYLFTMGGSGVLVLNGDCSSNVAVANGTVKGSGTINGDLNVISKGALSLDPSFNTRAVQGNYTQDDTGLYSVEIQKEATCTLQISGTASLNHSPVNVVLSDAGWAPKSPYLILSASGGISGEFATPIVTFLPSNTSSPWVHASIVYDPNLYAYVVLESDFASGAKTTNQKHVALQLDSIETMNPCESSLLSSLAIENSKELQKSLDNLSGEPYANEAFVVETTNRKLIQTVFEPLRPIIQSKPSSSTPTTTLWMLGGYGNTSLNSSKQADGLSMNGYDLCLGVHSTFKDFWTLGGAFLFEQDTIDYKDQASGKNNTFLGSLYTLYRPNPGYFFLNLVAGPSKNQVEREIFIEKIHFTTKNSPKTVQGAIYGEAGIDVPHKCFLFQPFGALQVDLFSREKFSESQEKCISLAYDKKTGSSTSSRLGLHMSLEIKKSSILMGIDAAWDYRLISGNHTIKVHFLQFGEPFHIEGASYSRSSFDGALFFNAKIAKRTKLFTNFFFQKWSTASNLFALLGLESAW